MLSATEVLNRIKAAEEKVSKKIFEEDQSSLDEVVKDLHEAPLPTVNFPASTVHRLAVVLDKLVIGLRDEEKSDRHVFKQSNDVLKKGISLYPNDVDLLNEQGKLFYEDTRYDMALASFDKVITMHPPADSKKTLYAMEKSVACLREQRRFTEAGDMVAQAIDFAGSTSKRLFIECGWLRFYQKLYDLAIEDFVAAQNIAGPEPTEKNRHDAMAGQIASLLAKDAQDPEARQQTASDKMFEWRPSAGTLSDKDAVGILSTCAGILYDLNLLPAALLNNNLILAIDAKNTKALRSRIDILAWLRRFKESKKTYRDAQDEFKNDVKLWLAMGDVYYQQKMYAEALSYYNGEATKNPDNKDQDTDDFRAELGKDNDAIEWTIVALRKMHNLKEAHRKADEALAIDGENINFLSEKAAVYFAERNYDKAIEFFDRALKIDEYNVFAQRWRAASLRKNSKADEANASLVEALKKYPASQFFWEERAWSDFDQRKFEEAGNSFKIAAELDPYLLQLQFSRVEAYARRELWDDALAVFQELQSQFPGDAEVAEQLTWFYLRMDQPESAREQYETILRDDLNNALGNNARGGYFLEQRCYKAAEESFRIAIANANYEPQYHINLALALLRQVKEPGEVRGSEIPAREKLIEAARTSCRQALKLDPYNAKAYGCLGVIAFKHAAFIEAKVYFLKSIELSPFEGSYVELASLYCRMELFDEATKILTTALDFNPGDARIYIEFGNIHALKQENKEAVTHCRKAIEVERNNADAHRALAIALMRSGLYDEAEKQVREALKVVAPTRQWRLYLLLSQILIQLGDTANKDRKQKSFDLYLDARKFVDEAKQSSPPLNADIFFHAGIVQYKLENYRSSKNYFLDCVNANSNRFDADSYSGIVQDLIDQERRLIKVNKWYGYLLAGICIFLLGGLWISFYSGDTRSILVTVPVASAPGSAPGAPNPAPEGTGRQERKDEFTVDKGLLNVMTPILLGLLVVAALLPNLNKLTLPGFEATISEPKPVESNVSLGPRGEIGFGSSLPIITGDPR